MMDQSENPLQLPVVDVSEPLDSSALAALGAACREWGFFQIINHGISKDLCGEIHSLSREIFSLPTELKLKLGPLSVIKSYTPRFIASPFFESIRVSGPDFGGSARCSAEVLGEVDARFSEVLQDYGSKVTELSKTILKLLLQTLGPDLQSKYYRSEFGNCHGYIRINNYTPPETTAAEEEQPPPEGLGMHTDMSCVTIVYQDQIGGLQVRSKDDGRWMNILPRDGTLVVNVGDMLQAWSNDRLRSSEHRVVLRTPTNRFSLVFFWCFDDHKVVRAPDDVAGDEGARIYDPFVCLDYLKFRESNERGRFEKVGFTVKDFAGIKAKLKDKNMDIVFTE